MKTLNKPLVSIIAPCYNGESYVSRFLDSVLEQTYTNIELIIINDGSKDNTENILSQYEKIFKEKNIIYKHIYQENSGIGAAINNALKLMNGEYFTWFGTDDYCDSRYVELLLEFLENNKDYAVVRNDGFVVDESDNSIILGKMADANFDKHNKYLFENAILERNFNFGYSMLRTSSFDKVNPKREIYPSREGQNWQLLLPLFYYYKSAFYEHPLYYVVENTSSVSRDSRRTFERAIAQQNEYENILNHVLNDLNIEDKNHWLAVVKQKYMHRRLMLGYQFKKLDLVLEQYRLLKENNWVTKLDKRLFLRSKFPFIDSFYKLLANIKKAPKNNLV